MPGYSVDHPKELVLPPNRGKTIGFTGRIDDLPTVYFTTGHYTQRHEDSWDVGWESFDGWQCVFFGNVPKWTGRNPKDDPLDIHKTAKHDDYVKKLNEAAKGRNRFIGGPDPWDLTNPDGGEGKVLRELWTNKIDNSRWAHPARHAFTPLPLSDARIKELDQQLDFVKPGKSAHLKKEAFDHGPNTQWKVVVGIVGQTRLAPVASSSSRSKSPVRFAPSSSGARPSGARPSATGKTT